MSPRSVSRLLVIALLAVSLFAAFQVRGLASPRLIRMSLATLGDGRALTYDNAVDRLRSVDAHGGESLAAASLILSISASGERAIVGTENELLTSDDRGHTLNPVLHDIHMWATALRGRDAAAVSWGRALYVSHDGGLTWQRARAPARDLQVNALLITSERWLAATQVGVLISADNGATWSMAPRSPQRATALLEDRGSILLGTWSGDAWRSSDGGMSWVFVHRYPSGIWSLAPDGIVGTATGLFEDGQPVAGPLGATEITSVTVSGGTRFASAPGSRVWANSGVGWREVQSGIRL